MFMKYNFIKTTDEYTKDVLIKEGFKLISQDGDVYTFINEPSLAFDHREKKIQYSNILTF